MPSEVNQASSSMSESRLVEIEERAKKAIAASRPPCSGVAAPNWEGQMRWAGQTVTIYAGNCSRCGGGMNSSAPFPDNPICGDCETLDLLAEVRRLRAAQPQQELAKTVMAARIVDALITAKRFRWNDHPATSRTEQLNAAVSVIETLLGELPSGAASEEGPKGGPGTSACAKCGFPHLINGASEEWVARKEKE